MESPVSSRNSSPDSQRRTSGAQVLDGTATPQMAFLQRQMQQQQQQQQSQPSSPTGGFDQKPPIPPRGAAPVASHRQSQENLVVMRNRQSSNGRRSLG